MTFIDTHTHLYSEEYDEDRTACIQRAIEKGVTRLYFPAIDSSYTDKMLSTKNLFPDHVFLMAGLHPCSVKENFKEEWKKVKEFMDKYPFCGIGETGLDFYWDTTFKNLQIENLHQHIQWAIEYKKPLILHTRNSMDEAIDIAGQYKGSALRGIFHCFTGTKEQAEKIIEFGFFLGIGGVLTFKNSGLDKVIREIDLSHLVLETDSPYLAPVPYRGKRNESSYIPAIAQKLAEVKNCKIEEIAEKTTANALAIFG
ncbi:MAG: TatD family hydrolase [Chitinophagaceae bacterium]|nr:TatD family hydrolase [Chitinophagaceae bacterium]